MIDNRCKTEYVLTSAISSPARALHRLLEWRYHSVPWPNDVIPTTQLLSFIIKRINEASGTYQMLGVGRHIFSLMWQRKLQFMILEVIRSTVQFWSIKSFLLNWKFNSVTTYVFNHEQNQILVKRLNKDQRDIKYRIIIK